MFAMHTALFIGLLALTAGISLYVWSLRNQGPGISIAKFFGIIIIVLSILDILCLSYYGVRYWMEGYFEHPINMMQMQNKSMPGDKGMPDNMIKKR